MLKSFLTALAVTSLVAGCATDEEDAPIELSNNDGKTDGSGAVRVTLTQDNPRASFIFNCKEWTWCDIKYGIYGITGVDYAMQLSKSGALMNAERFGSAPVLQTDLVAPDGGHYPRGLSLAWRGGKFEAGALGIAARDGMDKGKYRLDVELSPALDHATLLIGAEWK